MTPSSVNRTGQETPAAIPAAVTTPSSTARRPAGMSQSKMPSWSLRAEVIPARTATAASPSGHQVPPVAAVWTARAAAPTASTVETAGSFAKRCPFGGMRRARIPSSRWAARSGRRRAAVRAAKVRRVRPRPV